MSEPCTHQLGSALEADCYLCAIDGRVAALERWLTERVALEVPSKDVSAREEEGDDE